MNHLYLPFSSFCCASPARSHCGCALCVVMAFSAFSHLFFARFSESFRFSHGSLSVQFTFLPATGDMYAQHRGNLFSRTVLPAVARAFSRVRWDQASKVDFTLVHVSPFDANFPRSPEAISLCWIYPSGGREKGAGRREERCPTVKAMM